MRENRHEQGIVVPLPCLHMKAEIESVHSSYSHSGSANASTKCTLGFLSRKYLPSVKRENAGYFCKLVISHDLIMFLIKNLLATTPCLRLLDTTQKGRFFLPFFFLIMKKANKTLVGHKIWSQSCQAK